MMSHAQILEAVMEAVNEHFPIVHILRGGFPACGFTLHLPERWPPGHSWVSFQDLDASLKTTCQDCIDAMKQDES